MNKVTFTVTFKDNTTMSVECRYLEMNHANYVFRDDSGCIGVVAVVPMANVSHILKEQK